MSSRHSSRLAGYFAWINDAFGMNRILTGVSPVREKCERTCFVARRNKRGYWLAPEIVRREAFRLALQHRYFSPEWFAEFKDFLHRGSHPYPAHLLEELCTMVFGTETCYYCIRRHTGGCILGLTETD